MRPRYYQENAVNAVLAAIGDGKKRVLLTLATGTGKTFIAFQIVHKLLEAHWNLDGVDRRPKILFLADRNVLADQAINTFNPYENDFIRNKFQFHSKGVSTRRIPYTQGKDRTFWHIIQEGKNEDDRIPDFRRCERIRWLKAIIIIIKIRRLKCGIIKNAKLKEQSQELIYGLMMSS